MGDTPKKEMSEAWRNARVSGGLSYERRTHHKRIELAHLWDRSIPEVLDHTVSVHAAAQAVIAADVHEGLSLSMVMKIIKIAREFESAPEEAWREHQHVGFLIALRQLKAVINAYEPAVDDLSSTDRLIHVVLLLERIAKIIQKSPASTDHTD